MFEPFFTTKHGTGRGLSLPTVYSVVRQSGGFVGVITQRGAGTTVCLVLPEAGAMVSPPGVPSARPGDTQHVLVAEDDDDVRLVVTDVLRHAGFLVHEARDGFEALTLLHKHPVSLVIMDLLMPRMTGSQLIEQVKHLYPAMKLILMSAVAGKGMTDSLKGVPRIDKPFAPSDLLATIKRLQSA